MLQQWASAEGLNCAVAQATGLMTVALDPAPDAAIALVEHLRARLVDLGGSVVVLQIPDASARKNRRMGLQLRRAAADARDQAPVRP